MLQNTLTQKWLNLLADPYAILGVSVNADERQITKRYHLLAKQLHPDNYANNRLEDQELARVVFTQLINPAYEELKHTKRRLNIIAKLRYQASTMDMNHGIGLQMSIIQAMATMTPKEAQLFYEDAIKSYAKVQYHSLQQSYHVTEQLNAINMVYLSCQKEEEKLVDVKNQEKPIISQVEKRVSNSSNVSQSPISGDLTNYAQRHYERALEYTKQEQWNLATSELRDAIKIEPGNSDYYALLGVVYMNQKFVGMAKVYIRQALKLNPQQPLAVKYAKILQIEDNNTKNNPQNNPQSVNKALNIASLLSRFLS